MNIVYLLFLAITMSTNMYSQSFTDFLKQVSEEPDSSKKSQLIVNFLSRVSIPIIEKENVHFVYYGKADTVSLPNEKTGWNPDSSIMKRVPQTNLFYRTETLQNTARLEYKLRVDGEWILDPLNARKASGGYGENSDVWMPGYQQSLWARYTPNVRRGSIDTLWIKSTYLKRTHPVFVYSPPGKSRTKPIPVVYVTDGGEYLSLGKMNIILDNLIDAKKIVPVIAVFIDPRTDYNDAGTSKRMQDYSASNAYLDFVEKEVSPYIEEHYPASIRPEERLIVGASMGGLIATYAVLQRPDFITNAAAQSPAYTQANSVVITLSKRASAQGRKFYIDSGTIGDTEEEASIVSKQLKKNGGHVRFTTYNEGHNWTNWRARIPVFLEYFFGRR